MPPGALRAGQPVAEAPGAPQMGSQNRHKWVPIGQSIPSENITQVVLGPPTYTLTSGNSASSAATSCLINSKVAEVSIQLFGQDSTGYGKPAPADTCPS